MRALEFITGHVIFKLRYDQIYPMKTTLSLSKILKQKFMVISLSSYTTF